MAIKTILISKEEYKRLKKSEKVDKDLLKQIFNSLEDIKHGRIKEWKD